MCFKGRPLKLTLIDGTNSSNRQRMTGNMNSRIKAMSKDSSASSSSGSSVGGGGGRQIWTDIAKNYDSNNSQTEGNNYRNKRFRENDGNKQKEKEVFSIEDLDADLESYLSQRKTQKKSETE